MKSYGDYIIKRTQKRLTTMEGLEPVLASVHRLC